MKNPACLSIGVAAATVVLILSMGHRPTAFASSQNKPAKSIQYVVSGDATAAHLFLKGKGLAQLLVNASTGAGDVAVSILTIAPGAAVPVHTHSDSSETLYIERGTAEMSIDGKTYTAKAGDAVYIPSGVSHSAKVTGHVTALRAVQVYVGPGAEQRFASGPQVPPEQ